MCVHDLGLRRIGQRVGRHQRLDLAGGDLQGGMQARMLLLERATGLIELGCDAAPAHDLADRHPRRCTHAPERPGGRRRLEDRRALMQGKRGGLRLGERCRAGRFAASAAQQVRQRGQCLRGVASAAAQADFVAAPRGQRHDRHRRLGIGLLLAVPQREARREAPRLAGQPRRGPGMQPGGIRQHDGRRLQQGLLLRVPGRVTRFVRFVRCVRRLQMEGQQHAPAGLDAARSLVHLPHPFAIDDDDLRERGRLRRHQRRIEAQQRLPGADGIALADQRLEPLPRQHHGIESHVHHDLHARGVRDHDRVARIVEIDHPAVDRRQHDVRRGIDRQAVADHLLRERRIGNVFDRDHPAGQRGQHPQLQLPARHRLLLDG